MQTGGQAGELEDRRTHGRTGGRTGGLAGGRAGASLSAVIDRWIGLRDLSVRRLLRRLMSFA